MGERVSKRKATLFEKMKKALHLLLIQRKSIPGATGYELKKFVGRKYLYVIKLLNSELESFGLKIKIVLPEDTQDLSNPSEDEYLRARYYITSNEPLLTTISKGQFNIEELACLSASLTFIIAKSNKANLNELETLLETKISKTKSKRMVEKFRRLGYIEIDKDNIVKLGWRAKAELDIERLMKLLAIYR
ncbi:MAG TPA: hypothetical protein VKU94_05730 [Geobacterales bacterium]|nr:hypothetical protein [Geobacterales bacterium]